MPLLPMAPLNVKILSLVQVPVAGVGETEVTWASTAKTVIVDETAGKLNDDTASVELPRLKEDVESTATVERRPARRRSRRRPRGSTSRSRQPRASRSFYPP